MNSKASISIVGPGVVGTTLGIAAARAGWTLAAVGGRDANRTRAAAGRMGPGVPAVSLSEAAAAGDCILLTVSDAAIEEVCEALAAAGAFRPGSVIAHCSGALDSDALLAARDAECHIGSCHPLQTFPSVQAATDRLHGTHFFLEGDEAAAALLTRLVGDMGGRPHRLPAGAQAKATYHAAAVLACNDLTALLDAAAELLADAGLDHREAISALGPIVSATVENCVRTGPAAALTGPVVRGEVAVVRRHLEALQGHRDIAAIYRTLGRRVVGLAARRGALDESAARRMLALHQDAEEESA